MTDQEKDDVSSNQEINNQTNTEDTIAVSEPVPSEQSEEKKEELSQEVQNWRALREKATQAEKERDEALRRLQEREKEREKERENIKEEEILLRDDDLLEGKHLKSFEKKQAQRIASLEYQLIESRLKSEYPDFNSVVTNDTLGMLRDTDPELAESIAANPNIYSKAVAAYRSIKRYDLYKNDVYSREKEKVHSNTIKPRPASSLSPQQGESPLSHANAFAEGLTPELKQQLWKEMQECRKKS